MLSALKELVLFNWSWRRLLRVPWIASSSNQSIVKEIVNPRMTFKVNGKAVEKGGYTLVRLTDLGRENENKALGQFWHEGVALHPSDKGMERIAMRIVEKL